MHFYSTQVKYQVWHKSNSFHVIFQTQKISKCDHSIFITIVLDFVCTTLLFIKSYKTFKFEVKLFDIFWDMLWKKRTCSQVLKSEMIKSIICNIYCVCFKITKERHSVCFLWKESPDNYLCRTPWRIGNTKIQDTQKDNSLQNKFLQIKVNL